MITLTVLLIAAYIYGAMVFYKKIVKEAEWNMLDVKQTRIEFLFSGLFFISTFIGMVIGVFVGLKYLVYLIIKYLP